MKKLLIFILCLISCVSMTSCTLFNGEHNHKFRKRWESNAVYHWHECRQADCKEKGNYEKHTYENGKCTKCDYKEQFMTEHK